MLKLNVLLEPKSEVKGLSKCPVSGFILSTLGGTEVKAALGFGKAMAWGVLSILKSQKEVAP